MIYQRELVWGSLAILWGGLCLAYAKELPSAWIEEDAFLPIEESMIPLEENPKSCHFVGVDSKNPLVPYQYECEDFQQQITQFSCVDPQGENCIPNILDGKMIFL